MRLHPDRKRPRILRLQHCYLIHTDRLFLEHGHLTRQHKIFGHRLHRGLGPLSLFFRAWHVDHDFRRVDRFFDVTENIVRDLPQRGDCRERNEHTEIIDFAAETGTQHNVLDTVSEVYER